MSTDPPDEPAARPRPQYGEYAPPGWVSPNAADYGPPPTAAPAAPPTPGTPAWDRPLTYALLVAGFVGMSIGVFAGLNLELVIQQGGIMQGTDPVAPPWTSTVGWILAASHIILYAVAVTGALTRLQRGRPAYRIPLVAGIIAALIYQAVTLSVGLASGMLGSMP